MTATPRLSWMPNTARDWLPWSNSAAMVAAAVLAVAANLFAASSKHRIDVTADRRFTPSPASIALLERLREPVTFNVLLGPRDPFRPLVKPQLDVLLTYSKQVRVHWVDPDRDAATLVVADQTTPGTAPGVTKDGPSLDDTVIVVERGAHRVYLTIDDLLQLDTETGEVESRVEMALTQAIRELVDDARPVVCFMSGHGEPSLDDGSPDGLSELKSLIRGVAQLRTLELEQNEPTKLADCQLLALSEPEIPFSAWERTQISGYAETIGSLWIMAAALPEASGQIRATGLAGFLPALREVPGNGVVLEGDDRYRLPQGFGETFFAQVADHPITNALRSGNGESVRVLLSFAPVLHITPGAVVDVLLLSSRSAQTANRLSALSSGAVPRSPPDSGQELPLAIAGEFGSSASGRIRRFVVSPASLVANRVLEAPALVGNRAFVDGAVSWLLAKPAPEFPIASRRSPALVLTEGELGQINRYVLVVMPSAAIALGLALAIARRRKVCKGPQ